MQNIVLVVHLILSLCLIGIVLMQRSEGGGLGIGGGGGGANSGRPPSGPLAKVTWVIAGAFIATSLALVIISARNSTSGGVVGQGIDATQSAPADVALPPALEGNLLPPTATDAPATPPKAGE